MRNLFVQCFFIVVSLCFSPVYAQMAPVFQENFENLPEDRKSKGIIGDALNLSAQANKRTVLQYGLDKTKWKGSFTITSWVRADADFEAYNILNLVVNYSDSSQLNWKVNKQPNHCWSWELSKKDFILDYKPGPIRQNIIKDWNLLTMSYDSMKEEVSLYYNDFQVAIYSLEFMVPKVAIESIKLQIGGDEKGDLGEWETFNGWIDDVNIYNTSFNSKDVEEYFSKYKKSVHAKSISKRIDSLKVMTYNIWHGGNETGKGVGYKRIVEIIKNSDADIIAMQETYGSGPKIADELGYYFYLRSSNISIMSRYPIVETLKSFKAFHNGNALIQVGNQQLIFASVWLNYPIDYWSEIDKGNTLNIESWKKKQEGNKETMEGIIGSLKPFVSQQQYPIIMGGDFNSGSHLDWVSSVKELNAGYVMPFPTGKYLDSLGFKDTYRVKHPDPKKQRGITWTPINPNTHQDRIDYIFLKGNQIKVIDSKVINTHEVRYPSDHAAVLTTFKLSNQ